MIKAIGVRDGRTTLMIGLSFGNLDKFRAEPLDTFILIKAEDVGLDHDVMIFSGRTEEDMAGVIIPHLTPDAKTHVSTRKKN
jgi:hypothetical protein